MMPVEFLFFALFLALLEVKARRGDTDRSYLRALRVWAIVQAVLFVVVTVLAYSMEQGFLVPFGALYLLSLGLVLGTTIRMRATVEAIYFPE